MREPLTAELFLHGLTAVVSRVLTAGLLAATNATLPLFGGNLVDRLRIVFTVQLVFQRLLLKRE